jgi:hypothetical protein
MKKSVALLGVFVFLLVANLYGAQGLNPGEAAIFLKTGEVKVGEIVDISSDTKYLELKDGAVVPLGTIWMINFVDKQKDFPAETSAITTAEDYVFLKAGGVARGNIVDFSSEGKFFEFQSGQKIPMDTIRRIYFSKKGPAPGPGPSGPPLAPGEAAIFLKTGELRVGEIVDISSETKYLELKDGGVMPLGTIWMINFVDKQKDFPAETSAITTAEDYVFLKAGGTARGNIVDFSSEGKFFEFDTGQKIPMDTIRRIYFSKKGAGPGPSGPPLAAGEAAVFLKTGELRVGEIVDISSDTKYLEFKDGGVVPLGTIWMINFVDKGSNFPDEASVIVTPDHYVFLKAGGTLKGKIVDFSSEGKFFEFESGQKIPVDTVRRIYFSRPK